VRDLGGVRFEFDGSLDPLVERMRIGSYAPEVESAIRRLLHTGDTAIDVGANIGYLTAVMLSMVGPTGRVVSFEPEGCAVFKDTAGGDHFDVSALGKLFQPTGKRANYFFFALTNSVDVEFRWLKFNSPIVAEFIHFGDHAGDVQQSFRRNAAAQQTGPPGLLFRIDDGDVHAEVGRRKRGGVTAGTGADDHELVVGHMQDLVNLEL